MVYDKNSFSMDAFVANSRAYLAKAGERPLCMAASVNPTDNLPRSVQFTFDDSMLEEIAKDPKGFEKDFRSALTFGYIASANGGRNGIVRLRNGDERMRNRVAAFICSENERLKALGINGNYVGVKIVAHKPNGERTIGVLDQRSNMILFVDSLSYKR